MTRDNNHSENASIHTSEAARLRLKKRYQSERNFKYLGLFAIVISIGFLAILLSTITFKGLPAFTQNFISLPYDMSALDSKDKEALAKADYNKIIKTAIRAQFPDVTSRRDKRLLSSILSSGAPIILREQVLKKPLKIKNPTSFSVPISDFADLYLKGFISTDKWQNFSEIAEINIEDDEITISLNSSIFTPFVENIITRLKSELLALQQRKAGLELSQQKISSEIKTIYLQQANDSKNNEPLDKQRKKLAANLKNVISQIAILDEKISTQNRRIELANSGGEKLNSSDVSVLIYIDDAIIKIETVSPNSVSGKLLSPFSEQAPTSTNDWRIRVLEVPEASRKFSDQEIIWTDKLQQGGFVAKEFNWIFATRGASREPEMAGIWGAVVGTFLTIIITLALAFPLGVAAALYLEEFAPKNRITEIIEVNINNLAAVPSIVFGLLGLAVFLNFFGLDRSAPYLGGMVLGLMTLPIIIIASRVSLRAVPPSIREAAYGIGASKMQTIFHHVLPLATPGIMTGTIIGMARALGETAPLLMIGMVAFVVDIPGGFSDPATVLPVQIYMWADFPEPAFEQRTSAAILVLLIFLILMNSLAIFLRKKFERRW